MASRELRVPSLTIRYSPADYCTHLLRLLEGVELHSRVRRDADAVGSVALGERVNPTSSIRCEVRSKANYLEEARGALLANHGDQRAKDALVLALLPAHPAPQSAIARYRLHALLNLKHDLEALQRRSARPAHLHGIRGKMAQAREPLPRRHRP